MVSVRPDTARLRLTVIGLAMVALLGVIFVRLWYLQVINAPKYEKAVDTTGIETVYQPAPRGEILDRNGTVLVGEQTTMVVTMAHDEEIAHPAVIGDVAALLGMTRAQVLAKLNDTRYSPYQPVPIAAGVSMSSVIRLREHHSSYPGVSVQLEAVPSYPLGPTGAQVLGYTGPISSSELKQLSSKGYRPGDVIGQDGLEASYNSWLQGNDGVTKLKVDAQGRVVGTLASTRATPGDDLQLSLDAQLEQVVQSDLQNEMNAVRGTHDPTTGLTITAPAGAAVVLDPNNGQVLAMVSLPSYDPSVWTNGISEAQYQALTNPEGHEPLLNRAIDGLYTPGSTFKIATATAALDDGLITPTTTVDDTGIFNIPGCTPGSGYVCSLHDAEAVGAGPVNVTTALAISDDYFFYQMGYDFYADQQQYGPTPIQNTANAYGLGVATGVDLPGEATGQIDSQSLRTYQHTHDPQAFPYDTWFAGDQLEMAFGQGETLITPLQLATAYATFANGGTRYVPQVAANLIDPETGKVVKAFQPKVAGHVSLPPTTRNAMLAGFEEETSSPAGTGYGAFGGAGFPLSQFPVAGKTGTASHTGQVPTSLWVGFGPANNPQYVVAVVISQGSYGASAAAPVASQIFRYLMSHPVAPLAAPTSAQLASR